MKTDVTIHSFIHYLLTGMLVLVGNETISAQTYQTRIDCGSPNCEIVIDFTINVIDSSDTICGRWYLEADYTVTSDSCNKLVSIHDFYWKNITSTGVGVELYGETVHGQSGFYQLPYEGDFDMQLGFLVTTNCSGTQTETYTHNFEITAVDSCGWCSSSFCLNNMHCNVGSEEWRVDFCTDFKLWNGVKSKSLYANQNFDFPYIFYQTWPCQFSQFSTYLDLVEDMNQYFNGDPSGYAVIKYIEIGDPDWDSTYLCKIKFILRSSDYVIRELGVKSNYIKNSCELQSWPLLCGPSNIISFDYDNPQCLPGLGLERENNFGKSNLTNKFGLLKKEETNKIPNELTALISPNISNFRIELRIINTEGSKHEMDIFNLSGISVRKMKNLDANFSIPIVIHDLQSGIYFVKILDQQTRKHIIKRFIKI